MKKHITLDGAVTPTNIKNYLTLVILELRSMLPNHSHSKRSSQGCVCVSLVKLWLLVKKIEYRQTLFRRVIFSPGDLKD